MKKDKEWLKEQIKDEEVELKYAFDNYVPYEKVLIADDVNELLNQLEEPEQEKVVVPQFVAEYIEERKGMSEHWFEALDSLAADFHNNDTNKTGDRIFNWIMANPDLYVEGYRNGYTVEKEKRYYVYDKATKSYLGYNAVRTQLNWWTSRLENESFTEQEIKAIDERYWAFAEEITK